MARKIANYKVEDAGRDFDKVFVLTEMSASKAETWATKALLALMGNGVELPDNFERTGMAGMAEVGIRALSGLSFDIAEPLLVEMFDCVQIMPDPKSPHVVRALIEQDIEEVMTRIKIRAEVWKLHTDFLKAVAPSISSGSTAAARAKRSPNTKTSRQ